jgi:uncharacterized protein (TIGR02453 family)
MPSDAHFGPGLFSFLRELRENNSRDWFHVHKARYQREVRDPALTFISDFAPALKEISPHFRADPRPVGGSLFRIHRDVRFSKDKSPYKTAVGIQFRHDLGKDAHAPGFYLHLEPENVFLAAGSWRPDGPSLLKIRTRIAEKPAAWQEVMETPGMAERMDLEGDVLKRPPRGFDGDHPAIRDIKRKDFIAVARRSEEDALKPGFESVCADYFGDAAPLVRFLCAALDVPF